MFKVLLLDKYCTEILLKLGPVIETQSFFSDFYTVFQGYTLKFVEYLTTQSKKKNITDLFLRTFLNVLSIVEHGALNLKEKLRLGAWRLIMLVLGEGGAKLEAIIKKSDQFVQGINMQYVEGGYFHNGSGSGSGRKVFNSDSGYSS